MIGLDALLQVGGKLIDKLIPDPEAKARAQLPGRCDMTTPALPAIAFLIDACSGIQQYIAPTASGLPQRSFDERCEWVIDLFERVSMPRREI